MPSVTSPPLLLMPAQAPPCRLCGCSCEWLEPVDFNKSCEEARGKILPPSGALVTYALCSKCGFCFAPQLCAWPPELFECWIYNDYYIEVDPDYMASRPQQNADVLCQLFPKPPVARHLDYGGGNGRLASVLSERGWSSSSYDPFLERNTSSAFLGKFDMITAFEVFEHVPDVEALIRDLELLRAPDGVILFSTLISDGELQTNKPLSWWYAAPRNGHIGLFSQKSLEVVANLLSLNLASFSNNFHALFSQVPVWASHLIRAR